MKAVQDKAILAEAARQYEAGSPFASLLPLRLSNGAQLEILNVLCAGCRRTIEGDDVRGTLSPAPGDSYLAEGFAWCEPCAMLTPMRVRIRPDNGSLKLERLRWQPLFREEETKVIALDRYRDKNEMPE